MKKSIALVLVWVCIWGLVGCSFKEAVKKPPAPSSETTPSTTPSATIPSKASPTPPANDPSVMTEPSATPPETQPSATTPSQSESDPPPVIVQPEPDDDDFVLVKTYIPDIFVDLRYSTEFNFTNEKIYDFTDVWLRYGTVKKLISVQADLKQSGLSLKIWDGFRPPSAQFKLWAICPDSTYVSNPYNGFSSHSRGNTVDVTLVHTDGTELVMPTGFDDFSKRADRDYSDCSDEAATNATLLETLMQKYGFKPYFGEWWHFSDMQSYPVEEVLEPLKAATYYADCNEYISLRSKPNTASTTITRILVGEHFQVVAKHGDFALVEYNGLWGYVLCRYIQPVNEPHI
ncbi:MAG: SH3 domain-containing protein [Clostridia bacterium]|nr:SH3 domain-containing protein [Clostridia bacterium]